MNSYSALIAATAMLFAPAAIAGGYVAPVIETTPIVAIAPAQSLNSWTGPYIGANLGWGKGSVEYDYPNLKYRDSKPDGFSGALRAGYDWQIGQGVFGLGAEYGFGKFKGDLDVSAGGGEEEPEFMPFKIKNPAMIFARAGYAFNSKLLAYALLGYTWADAIDPKWAGGDGLYDMVDRSLNGVTIGAGAEFRFNKNWSAYTEYTYTDFGKITNITNPALKMDINLQQVKLGVNYRF